MGRDGGGERRPATGRVHEAVGRQYGLLGARYPRHAEGPSHGAIDAPFDDEPIGQRRQEGFQSFELGAEERVSAAAVRDAYNRTVRRLAAVKRRIIGIQPQ